ncbi:SIR2 family protein [Novosphingobium sp. P6W]|uniref:SIR2 family NAD-dependent protein deacylase n=1 Tax=Novosphingobium sp. P6W TaxID=1609758 RepID=UPI000A638CD2|nr:SIR2 family protein [Novosphingobium sp. P6W]
MSMPRFADDPHVERIAEALWMREPVGSAALLVGAGFSRNAVPVRPSVGTMPGWNDIYKVMVNHLYPATVAVGAAVPGEGLRTQRDWLLEQTGATSAYLRVAEEYEAQFSRDALDKLILRHVPDRQFSPGKLHRMLVELPWADILTTNWDTLLERAGEAAEDRVYEVLRAVEEIPEARAPRIIKLHGSFPSNRPFVFTEEDFRRYPERAAAFVNLAQQVAMENMLVLVGFSGDDPNFLFWSGWVRDRLGQKAPPIYLVGTLGLSTAKRKMLEGRGIQPVDLAALPEFANWPSNLRIANAHQWFLERLRAAEPYRAQRWPKPAPGFVPSLEFVTQRHDPRAPLPDPAYDGRGRALEKTRQFVVQWQRNREIYPGWVVAPLDTTDYVWSSLGTRFSEIVPGLRAMDEDERLDALFELNWQLEVALIPLVLTVDDIIIELLDAMVGRYDAMSEARAAHFRALALAVVRHAREEGDEPLFERWLAWTSERSQGDGEARDRLAYERILLARSKLEVDEVERLLASWTIEGDTFWHLRKAGLLADIGRDTEAEEISAQVLTTIRAQTLRGKTDIASWSRESIAMLFRTYAVQGGNSDWAQHQSARDRFDLRQDQLLARGCPSKRDFHDLVAGLSQIPPRIRKPTEISRRFDLGSTYLTHHLAGVDPRMDRLLAYKALRYQEETGLPIRINDFGLSLPLLIEAARWLIDIAPTRAIDGFLRASPSATNKHFDALLTRATIARIEPADADRLIERLKETVLAARKRIAPDAPAGGYWKDRLKSALEVASRVLLRSPKRAAEWLDIAISLQADPKFQRSIELANELKSVAKRCFEVAEFADLDTMLLALFSTEIRPGVGPFANDTLDLTTCLAPGIRASGRGPEWTAIIDHAMEVMTDRDRREAASSRLSWMLDSDLLDCAEQVRFGEVLWHPDFEVNGLPDGTIFLRSAFLSLPMPDGIDPLAAITDAILDGAPLTDASVSDGELLSAFRTPAFTMGAEQIATEVARLRTFVEGHAAEAARPDFFGNNDRLNLVEQTSRMAATLARRAATLPDQIPGLAELFDIKKYPLRSEPAMPALVDLGLLEPGTAKIFLRDLLLAKESGDTEILHVFLDAVLEAGPISESVFEEAIWSECAQAVATRQGGTLFSLLRFFAMAFCRCHDRVPSSVDGPVSIALGIILDETVMTSPADHLQYDPYLVRFASAQVATAMRRRNRGHPAVCAAWIGAIERDPLPETRRARIAIERGLAEARSNEEDKF